MSKLLHEKWADQLWSAPAWMRRLLPEEPPAEFWSAQYYEIMREFVEQPAGEPEVETAENQTESLADVHKNLTPEPRQLQLTSNPEDSLPPEVFRLIGSRVVEIRTRGDGACALHATFSSLSMRGPLAVEDPRPFLR